MFKSWRRKRLKARPFPEAWGTILEQNVRHYLRLSRDEQRELQHGVAIMAAEKTWVGCRGLTITDEIKVTIAGQASLLLLGGEGRYYFDDVLSILVYPDAFTTDIYQETFGEAWPRGPVVLSWRHVLEGGRDAADGLNVVLHEFAHQLDALDGDLDGVPVLLRRRRLERWHDVADREYLRLVRQADRDEITLLDHYGASDRAEFFAVATECFFERPQAMRVQHPELYSIFQDYYRQDPAAWFKSGSEPDTGPERPGSANATAPAWYRHRKLPEDHDVEEMEEFDAVTRPADTSFARGLIHLQNSEFDAALTDFSEAVNLAPHDVEARHHRALALYHLERYEEAVTECTTALAMDPEEVEAYRIRGLCRDALEQDALAVEDWNRVLAVLPEDAEAWYYRGLAQAEMGEFEPARYALTQAIRHAPEWAEPYLARSGVLGELGRFDAAEADRETAIRLDPELADIELDEDPDNRDG